MKKTLDIEQLKRFNVLIDHYKTLLEEVETRIDKLVPCGKKSNLNELWSAIDNLKNEDLIKAQDLINEFWRLQNKLVSTTKEKNKLIQILN